MDFWSLQVMDQLIITEEGEEAPKLNVGALRNMLPAWSICIAPRCLQKALC